MSQKDYTYQTDFEKCAKCTICTVYCPMSQVNPSYPGPKQAGPDGERLRRRSPLFYDEALHFCLGCKRCDVACPSDVPVSDIIQRARLRYSLHRPSLRDKLLSSTDLMGSLTRGVAPVVNAVTSLPLARKTLDFALGIDHRRIFPKYSTRSFEKIFSGISASQEKYPEKVAYYHGCYVNYNNPSLGLDLVKCLNALGVGVRLLEGEKCCGIAMISNGMKKSALDNAERNVKVISSALEEVSTVVATSSTCTLTIRDEYPSVLGVDNSSILDSFTLATRFIHNKLEQGAKLSFRPDFHLRVAYHAPCHMEKLGWGIFSERLLRAIPGVELVKLDSACCGMAGTFGFKKENYSLSQEIGEGLFKKIREADPDVVGCDCETCKWQIEMSTPYKVVHPISILAQALLSPEET